MKCQSRDGGRSRGIELSDGRTFISDIIVVTDENTTYYVEVELGRTNERDFFDKCGMIHRLSKYFFFVTPEEKSREYVEDKFYKWMYSIGGQETLKGCSAVFLTENQLINGKGVRFIVF
jgi:hypothetical protein